jgi:hypothetical protein
MEDAPLQIALERLAEADSGRSMRPRWRDFPNVAAGRVAATFHQGQESHGAALILLLPRYLKGGVECRLLAIASLCFGKLDDQLLRLNLDSCDVSMDQAPVVNLLLSDGVPRLADSIAKTLEFDRFKKRGATPDDLFRELRFLTERAGVFVLLIGDLGSHHSSVSEKVFRGFAIADEIAPFVVINDQGSRSRPPFACAHERRLNKPP